MRVLSFLGIVIGVTLPLPDAAVAASSSGGEPPKAAAAPVTLRLSGQDQDVTCGPGFSSDSPDHRTVFLCGPSENPIVAVHHPYGWVALRRDQQGEPHPVTVLQVKEDSRLLFDNHFPVPGTASSGADTDSSMSEAAESAQTVLFSLGFWSAGLHERVTGLPDSVQRWVDHDFARAKARSDALKSLLAKADRVVATPPGGSAVECRRSPKKPGVPEVPGCELLVCSGVEVEGTEYDAILYQPGDLGSFTTPTLLLSRPGSFGPIYFDLRTEIPGQPIPVNAGGPSPYGSVPGSLEPRSGAQPWQDLPLPGVGISMNAYQAWTAVMGPMGLHGSSAACDGPQLAKLLQQQVETFAAVQEEILGLELVQVFDEANGGFRSSLVPAAFISESICRDENGRFWEADSFSKGAESRYERSFVPEAGRAVSSERAQKLFDQLKARDDIPWGYTQDGCYARAEAAETFLQHHGIEVSKTWISGVLTPKSKPEVQWGYHVAASIPVLQADGSVAQMVFDPALASGPVTEEEWANLMELTSGPLMRTDFPPPDTELAVGRTFLSRSSDYPYVPTGDMTLKEKDIRRDAKRTNKGYRRALEQGQPAP